MEIINIGIDALGISEEGGGRTSILNFLEFLTAKAKGWNFVIYLSAYEPSLDRKNVKQIILPFNRGVISRLFMQIILPFEVLFRNLKLVHFTKGQASIVPLAKTILTIHDLTIIVHPEIHNSLSVFYWRNIQPWITKKMDTIFTVSKHTANDVIKYLNINPEKIKVIYNTSQFLNEFMKPIPIDKNIIKKYSLEKEYFLYVGVIALKKNIETLIRAVDYLNKNKIAFPPLVLVGPRYSASDASYVFDLIEELKLKDKIVYLGKLSKDDLYHVFKNAIFFVFPSLHEGFGIPCLEAMELGVPLIASNTSGVKEIVGNGGILINNYQSPITWANYISEVYTDKALRQELIDKGLERVKMIHSKYSTNEVIQIYQSLLENNKRN